MNNEIEHPTLYVVRQPETEAQIEELLRYLTYTELGLIIATNTEPCVLMASTLMGESPIVNSDERLNPFDEAAEKPEQFAARMESIIHELAHEEGVQKPVVVITESLNIAALTPLKVDAGGVLAIYERPTGREFDVLL